MRITKRQLRRIIREESKGSTKKYDDDSALRGDQDELPDALQKGIIDKTVEDREEAEDKKKKKVEEYGRPRGRHDYGDDPGGYFVDGVKYPTLSAAEEESRFSGMPILDSSDNLVLDEALMKITKRQLRRIIREEIMAETIPTFGLRSGDSVRHKDEPELGVGRVVAKSHKRDRVILVKWEAGFTRRHDPSSLTKER
jgi:hypothetical protein